MKNLSDQWRATIRSSLQAAGGTILTGVVALLLTAQDWVDGDAVDWAQEMSNFAKFILTTIITLLTGLLTYFMNRGDKGATYK